MTEPTTPPPSSTTGGPIGDEDGLSFRQIAVRVLLIAVVAIVLFLVLMMIFGARVAG
jgi:hypothetical protein